MQKYKLITPISAKGSVKKAKLIEAYSKMTRNSSNHPFETSSKVALKFLKNTYDSLEEVAKIKEVQTLKRLPPHPNIIKMIELLYDAPTGRAVIVFEHMESDLHVMITDRPDNETLSESAAQSYFFQILKGIKHMHNCGIFHSNITPKNILISKDTIKICDFSCCKDIFSGQPYPDEIKTVSYSSPEMVMCKGFYDYKVDIWGAGCVFYELLK